ncbi:MAG: hypothetical protein ACE5HX_14785 [bacterium]
MVLSETVPKNKESAETRAAPETLAKGPNEQHLADAPKSGARFSHCFISPKARKLSLAIFREAENGRSCVIELLSRPFRGRVHFRFRSP